MKNKFTIVYTIFASIGFLFAISFLGLNLYREYKYNNLNVDTKFNKMIGELSSSSKDPTLTTKSLIDKLNKSIGTLNDFSFLSISVNNVEIIKYPSKANQNETSSKLTKSYNKVVQTEVGNFNIACNIYLLKPSSIFYYGKVAFIIVLLITLLTIVIIIYENVSEEKENAIIANDVDEVENTNISQYSNNSEEDNNLNDSYQEESQNNDKVPTIENHIDSSVESATNINKIEEESNTITESEKESIQVELNSSVNTDPTRTNSSEDDKQIEEKAQLPSEEEKPLSLDNSNTPRGLFDPVTGLGWEEYLLTRLDSELNRAIASEIDFSLFIIELPGLSRDSEYIKNVCNYLTLQFQFKDLLFEYGEDCLVAMKINMNLDEALNLADKVYAGIKNIIEDNPCYIGISTRSIRMVSGQRVLKEATEALAHTKDDEDSPIIAFRVDADKYRQFLEQNNSN